MAFTVGEFLTKWGFEIESEKLDKTQQQLEGIKSRLNLIIGLEVAEKVVHFVEKFAKFGEELHNVAVNSGLSVEQLQKLSFAANQAGVSTEQVQNSMFRLGRILYDARTGSKQASEALQKAGFTGEQLRGFKDGQDVLMALSKRMSETPDIFKRQAIASALLGRNSKEMVGWLSQGPDKIRAAGDELAKFGAVLNEKQVQGLAEFFNAIEKGLAIVKGLSASIAALFAPSFNAALDIVADLFLEFKNLFSIDTEGFQDGVNELVAGVITFFVILLEAIKNNTEFLHGFWEVSKGVIASLFQVLGAVFDLVKSFGKLAESLGLAIAFKKILLVALIFLMVPLRAVARAIEFLAIVFDYLSTGIDKTVGFLKSLADGIAVVWSWLTGKDISNTWLGKLLNLGGGALSSILDKISGTKLEGGEAVRSLSSVLSPGTLSPGAAAFGQLPQIISRPVSSSSVVHINAPMEFTVPPGTVPEQVGSVVSEKMLDFFEWQMRKAQRGTTGNQKY